MFRHPRVTALLAVAVLTTTLVSAAAPRAALAASLPPALVFTPVVTGLTQPVFVTNAGDGTNRIFILQRTGQIRIFKNGSLLGTPFLDISSVPGFTTSGSEQGLLGLAFDPNYAANRTLYITYAITTTDATFPYAVRLARYRASSGNPDVADPTTATALKAVRKKWTNHNGGMIAFGPDGYLYWGIGDGGSGGDPDNNAQNIHRLLGKILRLDVHTTPPAGKTYVIPPTNPFYGSTDPTVKKEIWAYGLRNPWRFAFDRSTGRLFIGDVGQNTEEEIDFQPASAAGGQNYGWHILEGKLCYSPSTNCTKPSGYVGPVATYDHGANDSFGCSVTGGYVYRGSASPTLDGVYFYGDFCSGKVLGLVRNSNGTWSSKVIASTGYHISSFGEDEAGELYLADYGAGQIVKISQVTLITAPPFVSEASLDGTVVETGENTSVGGGTNATGETFLLGDTANRRQRRALLSFDTSALPDNAVLTAARLKIKLASATSPDPFSILGRLKVDLAVPHFGPAAALESVDFQAAATKSAVAAFNPTPNAGWYTAPIAKASLGSIDRQGRTQFRLRFGIDDDNDSVADYAAFFSGDASSSADRPVLVVQYYLP